MEKIQINNQIISMRKLVKQAKVHLINKLVKEVKQQKSKKGDETKIAKHQRKAERLILEINLIKKMNVDVVSKTALSKQKDWKLMISDKSVSLEERAMARLICFAPLQKEVQQFVSKFPHLIKILPDLIQEWEEKKSHAVTGVKELKAAEIKRRKKEKHLKKKIRRLSNDTPPESSIMEKRTQDIEESSSTGGDLPASPSTNELPECDKMSVGETHKDDFCDSDINLLPENEKENEVKVSESVQNHKNIGRHSSPSMLNKDYSHNKFNQKSKNSHKLRKIPMKKTDKPNRKPTVSGLSNRQKKQDFPSREKGTGANSEICPTKSWKNLHGASENQKRNNSAKEEKVVPSYSHQKNSSLKDADKKTSVSLHPSWEAKRKMNMMAKSFVPFKGKKITFDE